MTTVTSIFATLAMLLAAAGLYAVMSHVVLQRTRELGLRIALGAQSLDVAKVVVRKVLMFSVAGILAGLLLALGASQVLASLLFGVSAVSPTIYATVALTSLAMTVLACVVPAVRAVRVDPVATLNSL